MDFEITAEEKIFEAEVERFLRENYSPDVMDANPERRCHPEEGIENGLLSFGRAQCGEDMPGSTLLHHDRGDPTVQGPDHANTIGRIGEQFWREVVDRRFQDH